MVRRRRIAEALQRARAAQGGLPPRRRGRMQRKRDHGAQRTWDDERACPLHQSGGSGAARSQCVGEGGHPTERSILMSDAPSLPPIDDALRAEFLKTEYQEAAKAY